MFCDFSIVYQPNAAAMAKMLARARAAGYDVVAIDHIMTERLTPKHENPIPKLLEDISKLKLGGINTSFTVSDPLSDILGGEKEGEKIPSTVGAGGIISRGWSGSGGLKVLSRLTLVLNDISMGQCINNCPAATQQYDIVAVQPSNEATLTQAMSSLSIDLIAFDLTKAIPRAFKHQTVQPAKERGIYFEIPYAPAILDQISRRQLFFNGNNLIRALHGANLILTSQASTALDIRGPYDVANLGSLFEINQSMAKQMLTTGPLSLITRAETRKFTDKAIVAVAQDISGVNQPCNQIVKSSSRSADGPPELANPEKKPRHNP